MRLKLWCFLSRCVLPYRPSPRFVSLSFRVLLGPFLRRRQPCIANHIRTTSVRTPSVNTISHHLLRPFPLAIPTFPSPLLV